MYNNADIIAAVFTILTLKRYPLTRRGGGEDK
jgi:hypothetical protein